MSSYVGSLAANRVGSWLKRMNECWKTNARLKFFLEVWTGSWNGQNGKVSEVLCAVHDRKIGWIPICYLVQPCGKAEFGVLVFGLVSCKGTKVRFLEWVNFNDWTVGYGCSFWFWFWQKYGKENIASSQGQVCFLSVFRARSFLEWVWIHEAWLVFDVVAVNEIFSNDRKCSIEPAVRSC